MISASYLSIGCGFQEAETVPKAFTGQTELDLLLQDGGSALQNDLVILHPKHNENTQGLSFWDTLFNASTTHMNFRSH